VTKKTPLLLIFLTVFIDLLGFGILIPILPTFATKELGLEEAAIGIVIAIYSLTQLFFNPLFGKLSDKYGRRPVIVVSLLLNASGYILFSFTHSYLMLLLSRIIAGIGGSSIGVAQAYIADVTTREERSKGMGLIGAAFGLGFVFGPLIGGFLAKYGYAITGYAAAGFSLLAFLLTLLVYLYIRVDDLSVLFEFSPIIMNILLIIINYILTASHIYAILMQTMELNSSTPIFFRRIGSNDEETICPCIVCHDAALLCGLRREDGGSARCGSRSQRGHVRREAHAGWRSDHRHGDRLSPFRGFC
jgi:multidrug resistance protein